MPRRILPPFVCTRKRSDELFGQHSILSGLPPKDLEWQYWMVGIPSWSSTPYLAPLLTQRDIHFILYPYQVASLARRVERWEGLIHPNLVECADALALFARRRRPTVDPFDQPPKLRLRDPRTTTARILTDIPEEAATKAVWDHFDVSE
jgi:hypothetical protein